MRVETLVGRPAHIVAALVAVLVWALPTAAVAAPPPNDAFAARTTIPALPFEETQSTLEATEEPDEPSPRCGPMGKTIWYQFTPGSDMVLAASMSGSDFDTLLAVWTGTSLASLTEVGCADFGSVVFAAQAGETYLVQAGGWFDSAGSARVRLRETEAGVITGTVTEDGTGTPLADICVDAVDADFLSFVTVVTDTSGVFRAAVRPGVYVIVFYDWCDDSNDHRTEVFDDKPFFALGDEVTVSGPTVVTGVDASLALACPGYGDFRAPHYVGTDGPDVFVGTDEPEIFCGLGGKDVIRGGGGRDRIFGGGGPDRLSGGAGSDYIFGEKGADRLAGGADRDFCSGGKGKDRANRSCERTRSIP
ncbi:MAG: calcium-binding protein [Actinomycetota bacterium]